MQTLTKLVLLLMMTNCCTATIVKKHVQTAGSRTEHHRQNSCRNKCQISPRMYHQNVICSCLIERSCMVYQYRNIQPGNCILIQKDCFNAREQIFENHDDNVIYIEVNQPKADESWNPPSNWTGPEPAFYQSFDSSDGLCLMEGSTQMSYVTLISGKVNKALSLNHETKQWVDLGIHAEICLTRPDTCGAASGAISFWINVTTCGFRTGIVSSYNFGTIDAFGIFCDSDIDTLSGLAFSIENGLFTEVSGLKTGWNHVVMNISDQNEMQIYYNGDQVETVAILSNLIANGKGRIAVGRGYTDRDEKYTTMQIDELIFFNHGLSEDDIRAINNGA